MVHALKDTPYMKMINETKMGEIQDGTRDDDAYENDGYESAVANYTTIQYSMTFENGFHVGAFYAYIQLRMQEIN